MDPVNTTPNASTVASPPRKQQQGSRKNPNRARKDNVAPVRHLAEGGSVSDTVGGQTITSRSRKSKTRPASAAKTALSSQSKLGAKNDNQKTRSASTGGNVTPLKEQAYAGPTFQTSPAPSSLPVPKFFSKGVSNAPAQSMGERLARDGASMNNETSPGSEIASPEVPSRTTMQSPLDFFFQAQRAEKEKSHSSSMNSPELSKRHGPPATEPRMFTTKTYGLEESQCPATRPQPHRTSSSQSTQSNRTASALSSRGGSDDVYTQSLKDLLFNNVQAGPVRHPASPHLPHPHQQRPLWQEPFKTPSPVHASISRPTPSSPTPPSGRQNSHYHYGNRNLSPLFKAARGETTPPRPSNLRQNSSAADEAPVTVHSGDQRHLKGPTTFSHGYLNHYNPPAAPSHVPPVLRPVTAGTHTAHPPAASPVAEAGASASPDEYAMPGNHRDIQSMEDDLRRLLKVDVVGT